MRIFHSLRRRSLFFTVGVLGLCAASGAQQSVIDGVAEDIQIEALLVEAEEVSVDQPELVAPDDIVEPADVVESVAEEPDVEIVEDLPKDAVDSVADVPIEWVIRDSDQIAMYSLTGAGGIDDTADDVASRAAETAANRSLDQIDAALPDSANLK
jgi:hypothetical protein